MSKNKFIDKFNYSHTFGRFNNLSKPWHPQRSDSPWALETGTVFSVDEDDFSCSVDTDGGQYLPRVSYISPWFSFSTGAGMYTMPESKSRVLLGQANNGEWYILGFTPLQNGDEYYGNKNGRRDLNRGDICFSTAYGNYIEVRKNAGYITIHNNEACKIILESAANKAVIHSQRLLVNNAAGTIEMTVNDKGDTVTSGLFKMRVNDDANFVKILMGSVGLVSEDNYHSNPATGEISRPEIILSLNVCNKFSITIDTDGNITTYGNNSITKLEQDRQTFTNGMIYDGSATDILHAKISRSTFTAPNDGATSALAKYLPASVDQVPSPAPNEFNSPPPTAESHGYSEGAPPDIDPDANPAPPPTGEARIVAKAMSDWDAGRGRFGRKGVMTIYNSDGSIKGNYQFVNGPWGKGAIPLGNYSVSRPVETSQKGMAVLDPATGKAYGWKCFINDVYDPRSGSMRTLLRIHPDGNSAGTEGCFGIRGSADTQKQCFQDLKEVLRECGGQCILEYIA